MTGAIYKKLVSRTLPQGAEVTPAAARKAIWVLALGLAMSPAGAQGTAPSYAEQVVRLLAAQDETVLRVGERLAVRGAPLCGAGGWSAGMTVQQLSRFGAPFRAAATAVLGVTTRPTITAVAAGGAAAAAGLQPGDVIAAIDGTVFAAEAAGGKSGDFAATARAHDAIDRAFADGRAQLVVVRGGREIEVAVAARPGCAARFDVRAGRSNNASSDGTYVQISSDLIEQAHGDAEVATVLAHELAHNILRHPQQLKASGPRPRVRDTEKAADRLSVYLLDAAGYPVDAAVAFWSRWGRQNDLGIFSDRSHPGWKQRVASIATEAAAIAAARAAGQAVRPPADLLPR